MTAALGLLLILQSGPQGPARDTTGPPVDSGRLTSFEFAPISSPKYAGDSFGITVTARDEYGALYSQDFTALLTTSLGLHVFPEVVQFTDGVCVRNVVVALAADLQLRCSAESAVGTSNTFEVLPGVPARMVTVLPGESIAPGVSGGRIGRPDSHIAGDIFSFSVYLTDEWYNLIALRDDSVYLGATDSFAQIPAGGRLSNGSAYFVGSVRASGRHRLFAKAGPGSSIQTDSSTAFTVVPGSFAQLLMVAPGEAPLPGDIASQSWETPGKSGTPDVQFLRTPFPVWVYATDRCWNAVTGPGHTVFLRSDFEIEFTPGSAELRDIAPFMVQFNDPGPNQDLWVVDQQTGQESYRTKLNIRAVGNLLEVLPPLAETVPAGETIPIRVVVRDANDAPIVAVLVRSSVVKGNGDVLDPSLLTDTLGMATIRFLATRAQFAEHDTISISSGNATALVGLYVDITDSAVMHGRVIAYPNPFGWERDHTEISYYLQRSSDVTMNIYDPFGNLVQTWRFPRGENGARAGLNRGIYWDGTNLHGRRVASGIYLVEVIGELFTGTTFKNTYRIGVVW